MKGFRLFSQIDPGNQCRRRKRKKSNKYYDKDVVFMNYLKPDRLAVASVLPSLTSGGKAFQMTKENVKACFEKRLCKEINRFIQSSAFLYRRDTKERRLIMLLGWKNLAQLIPISVWIELSEFHNQVRNKSYSAAGWLESVTVSAAAAERPLLSLCIQQ